MSRQLPMKLVAIFESRDGTPVHTLEDHVSLPLPDDCPPDIEIAYPTRISWRGRRYASSIQVVPADIVEGTRGTAEWKIVVEPATTEEVEFERGPDGQMVGLTKRIY